MTNTHGSMTINLKKLREELGWQQTQLADYLGYHRNWIMDVESGTRAMSEEFKSRLINAIRVHIEDAEKILQKLEKAP